MVAKKGPTNTGALTGQALQDYIRQQSIALGLDPQAVLSVATVEGGFSGAVGDSGTSFGPFQLHIGGALPAGKGKAWAQSKAGVKYALQQIAKVAKGLTGKQAVTAIVRNFERPAAPDAEIARAMGVYGSSRSSDKGPTTASGVNLSTFPGLTGGDGTPYQLEKKSQSLWERLQTALGLTSINEYNDFVQNWNAASKRQAEKMGVNSAEYKQWIRSKLAPIAGDAQSDIETGLSPGDIAGQFTVLLKASTWARVGMGVLGAIAIIGAFGLFANELGLGKAVGQVVGVVGPGGKVAKAVQVTKSVGGKA